MTRVVQIGPAPFNEPCAQLGCTPDFDACNRLELAVYRAALIATHGPPPDGVELAAETNRHDFGTYCELVAVVETGAEARADVVAYVDAVEEGLGSWISAGFTAPILYDRRAVPVGERRTAQDVIASAMLITRPGPGGTFFPAGNEVLHRNLLEAFPEWIPSMLRDGGALGTMPMAETRGVPVRD